VEIASLRCSVVVKILLLPAKTHKVRIQRRVTRDTAERTNREVTKSCAEITKISRERAIWKEPEENSRVFDFSALVMSLYPNAWQEPLSTSLFWRWLGLTLALSLHGAVCTRYRVLGLAATLVLAVVPYLWLESRLARRGKTLAPL